MSVFTPDNEPYLGRASVYHFDQVILSAMEANQDFSKWTHANDPSDIQSAACQIIPSGFSLSLSIRELIRQGYLFPASVLIRPLIERAALISYLVKNPEKLELWEQGWSQKTRPPLWEMIAAMDNPEKRTPAESKDIARAAVDHHSHILHGDPIGSLANIGISLDGSIGFLPSKELDNVDRCDQICFESTMYLIVLLGRAVQIFPKES